jgi:hypothetical protein
VDKQKQFVGSAEVEDKHLVRVEILGYEYYLSREELTQLLHGHRQRILVYENRS